MSSYKVRIPVEALLGGDASGPYRKLSNSKSEDLVKKDLVGGNRPHGKMSTDRRFFCMLVTFDLLFTILMWLICVMIKGETLQKIFIGELLQYSIKVSSADIVMLAIYRFLLLFYVVLYINNRSVIALTTSGTYAFLIAKVFVFDWPNAAQPVFQVFLILASFALSWGEASFLDFWVLPQELQAKQIIETTDIVGEGNVEVPVGNKKKITKNIIKKIVLETDTNIAVAQHSRVPPVLPVHHRQPGGSPDLPVCIKHHSPPQYKIDTLLKSFQHSLSSSTLPQPSDLYQHLVLNSEDKDFPQSAIGISDPQPLLPSQQVVRTYEQSTTNIGSSEPGLSSEISNTDIGTLTITVTTCPNMRNVKFNIR